MTKELLLPLPDIWVETRGPVTRAAAVEGRQLVALEVDHAACTPRAGARFVGRVTRLIPPLRAVEVDIGAGHPPAFMKARDLKAGEAVQVEWIAPPSGDKLAVVRHVKNQPASGSARCVAEGPDALTRLKARYPQAPVRHDNFDLIDLDGQITHLTHRRVPLGTQGSLVFDSTEAAHIIDINGTGKTINRQALHDIARHIRLRNLGGIILVDLVGDRRQLTAGLCDAMRQATHEDPCRVEIYGITPLGLMEMTRERKGWELARLLRS